MKPVIATITLIDNSEINITFFDRKVELMGSTPVAFYLKVTTEDNKMLELPFSSILKIEYKNL